MRKWKRELDFVAANAGVLGIAAFLAAMGGVLLWVSGGSGWYFYKTAGREAPSVAALFTLSLAVCGLCGLSGALIFVWGRAACPMKSVWPPACMIAGVYLAHLGWYAAALCTRMTLFGGILAVTALGSRRRRGFSSVVLPRSLRLRSSRSSAAPGTLFM